MILNGKIYVDIETKKSATEVREYAAYDCRISVEITAHGGEGTLTLSDDSKFVVFDVQVNNKVLRSTVPLKSAGRVLDNFLQGSKGLQGLKGGIVTSTMTPKKIKKSGKGVRRSKNKKVLV